MKSELYLASKSEVVKAVKVAIQNLELDLEESDEKNGIVKASYSGSLLSWGNNVDIEITKSSNQKIKLSVTSASKAQLFSWGVNDDLENSIINEVTRILEKK